MKPEIKKRIEQLNKGKVPSGYKKTEFGVFSCDWVTDKKLKDIGIFGKGKGIPGDKMQSEGVPCVGYGDIYMKYNSFHFEEARSFVDEETAKESQIIKKGTLLFTGTGETADEIGKCVCYNGNEDIYVGGDIITFVTNQVNPLFIAYQQYQSFSLKKKASYGQGHSVVHIQKGELEKLNVAYPASLQEQSRIAEILMKWDKAIELYEKQIETLKKLKTYYLSVLFPQKGETTPKSRFKGFTEPWEQRKFGECYKMSSGYAFKYQDYCDNGVPLINGESIQHGSIDDSNLNFLPNDFLEKYSDFVLHEKDIVVGLNRPITNGNLKIAKIPQEYDNSLLYQRAGKIQYKCDMDEAFSYVLLSKEILNFTLREAVGSDQPFISTSKLDKWEMKIPKSKKEQVKIGTFLIELDSLIALHQRKLETVLQQRKTLQQYLLNGIVRIKEC